MEVKKKKKIMDTYLNAVVSQDTTLRNTSMKSVLARFRNTVDPLLKPMVAMIVCSLKQNILLNCALCLKSSRGGHVGPVFTV